MKNFTAIAVAVALLVPMMASGQEAQERQLWWIGVDEVVPAKAQGYEDALKDFFALYRKHGVSYPNFAYVGIDSTYGLALPLKDFADFDQAMAQYRKVLETEGAKAKAILKRFGEALNGGERWFSESRPDLSYVPENPRLKPEEATYTYLTYIYTNYGEEEEIEALIKKVADLYKKHNLRDGFGVGAAISGYNLPFYTVGSSAKDALDYQKMDTKIREVLGDELESLIQQIRSYERSRRSVEIIERPDLSYTPE